MARDPDDTPTQPSAKVTASFSVFQAESTRIAAELDTAAMRMAKRIDMLDTAGARRAEAIADSLRALSKRFAAWPRLSAEEVARERSELTGEFFRLVEEAIRIFESLPAHPALGTPHAHR